MKVSRFVMPVSLALVGVFGIAGAAFADSATSLAASLPSGTTAASDPAAPPLASPASVTSSPVVSPSPAPSPTPAGGSVAPAATVDLKVSDELVTTSPHYAAPTVGGSIDPAVTNVGTTTQTPRLTIALPSGWRAAQSSDSGYPSGTCVTTGSSFVCTLPAVDAGQSLNISLVVYPPSGASLGSTSLAVHVDPVGNVDANPADNDTTFTIDNVGDAVLKTVITQSGTTVGINGEVTFTVVVTNAGPATTVGLDVTIRAKSATMNGFLQLPPTGPGSISAGGATSPVAGNDYDWQPGELAAGQSATLRVTWRGLLLGATGELSVTASSAPTSDAASVTATSQPLTVGTVSPSTAAPSSSVPSTDLANTGPQYGRTLAVVGILMLAVGAVLTASGRRVAQRRH